MKGLLRKSGIDIIGNVPWGTHFCQFYQTKEDLIDVLVPYFKAGLENNEFCMWVTSQPLEAEEAKEALRRAVPDVDIYLEKGQMEIIPDANFYLNGGIFDPEIVLNGGIEKLKHAIANGYDGLRLTGDTFWLEKKDWNTFVDYEEEVDRVIGNYQMIAICTYCLERCNVIEIIDVVTNHQFTLIKREGRWEQIESPKRKKAEETAIQATKNWKYTFDAVPDLIAIIDNEYRIARANRAMAARLGITPEECTGLTCYQAVHGTDEPPSFCPHRRLLEDGLEHTVDVCEDFLGGYFIVSTSPLHDSEGKLTGSIHVARDINERKNAEDALIRSENQFRTLAENSPDIIARYDRQKRHLYANPAATEPYGRCPKEIIGRTNSELGMDPELVSLWEKHYEKVFATGKPEIMEFHYKSPEGKEYYFNTRVVPDLVNDEVTSVLAISHDITDIKKAEAKLKGEYDNLEELVKKRTGELENAYNSLKESEERYRIVTEQTGQLVYDYNVEEDTSDWAGNIEEITGYTPEKYKNMSLSFFLSCIHPEDRKMFLKKYHRLLTIGGTYGSEYRFKKENGEYIYVENSGVCLKDERSKVKRILGAVKDVTERKKAEEILANIETLRKREIHHRIKNNLQVISSLLDLQAEKLKNRKHAEDSDVLAAFRESQDRVLSIALIHEELHECRGTDKLSFCPYLEKLIENLFETYRVGNVDLSLFTDLEENIFFDMDIAVPLGLIVNEIVSNSLKYAFSGRDKGTIRIRLCREEAGESASKVPENKEDYKREITNFVLTVSDNGVGLPENFNPEDSDTLGIQLIFILIDQLEGRLELKTDSGTEFIIRFAVQSKVS
jgi:PAS domain S-box-containing protein